MGTSSPSKLKSGASGRGTKDERGPKLNRRGEGVAMAEESTDTRGGPNVERRDKPSDMARGLSEATGIHAVPRCLARILPGGVGVSTASSTASICKNGQAQEYFRSIDLL